MSRSLARLACLALIGCGGVPFTYEVPSEDAGPPPADDAGAQVVDVAASLRPEAGAPEAAAGDGAPADARAPVYDSPLEAASPEASPEPEACVPVKHSAGLGAFWTDCTPLGTFTPSEAMAACVATYDSQVCAERACVDSSTSNYVTGVCGPNNCWIYSATEGGSVLAYAAGSCSVEGATWK